MVLLTFPPLWKCDQNVLLLSLVHYLAITMVVIFCFTGQSESSEFLKSDICFYIQPTIHLA